MKRFLLSFACASTMVASAQVAKMQNVVREVQPVSKIAVAKNAVLSNTRKANAPFKAAADGVYYKTPVGSMWAFADRPLYGYNSAYHIVAPWTDLLYQNMGTKKDGKWTIKTATAEYDLTENTDENNNLIQRYQGGTGGYYAPDYTESNISYVPATEKGEAMVNFIQGIGLNSFHPTNVGTISFYGGGSLDNGNLYGGGTFTETDRETGAVLGNYVSIGIIQDYPKPLSPLYVESINIWGNLRDASLEPLNGKTLTMQIYNLEDENADPVVLTCTPDECVLDREQSGRKYYKVNFTKKVVDEISGETVADAFVIDYPSEIIISGFDQDGVNLGLMGYDVNEEFLSDVENENETAVWIINTDTKENKFLHYPSTVVALGFNSMFDICAVDTEGTSTNNETFEINGIAVSDDGQTYANNVFSNIHGVQVYTALDWADEETGEEMYWSDDMYDYEWIQNLVTEQVIQKYTDGTEEEIGGCYHVGAICDALPSGVTKRYAVIHLNGRGVTSEPIFVLQGNITLAEAKADYIATGITNVKNNEAKKSTKKFNLAGQQVDNNFKGIVISNGKKTIKRN